MLLSIRQMHLQPTRKTVPAKIYLCGQTEETRGSSTQPSFAPVAQPRNLDWLGPGS
jgi:hypothetical protein